MSHRSRCLPHGVDNVDIWWVRNKYPSVIVDESFIFITQACFQLGSCMAWKEDLGIGCCEVGGGGGGGGWVIGGVGVVCSDGVDSRVGCVICGVVCGFVCGVVCGVVKEPISTMIVSVPEKDRWFGTRGKFVRWKGVRVTKASKHAKMGVRGWFVE
ncbi:hypothetical protein Tco_0038560 [Tanacetum coccineum]